MKRFQTQMEVQYTEKNVRREKEFYLVSAWNFYGTIKGQEAERRGVKNLGSLLLTLNW